MMKSLRLIKSADKNEEINYRLICFPHAGGGASFYYSWKELLEDNVELYSVQYPGHFDRIKEKCMECMRDLVEEISYDINSLSKVKTIFFGHSLGAIIAYEVSRNIKSNIIKLCVSGRNSPRYSTNSKLHELEDDEFIKELLQYKYGENEVLLNNEVNKIFLPSLRADYKISEMYKFDNNYDKLDIPVNVFYGEEDEDIKMEGIEDWKEITTNNISINRFSGGHFYLMTHKKSIIDTIFKN